MNRQRDKTWCCFWEGQTANILSVGVHGLLTSTVGIVQCVLIYLFAIRYGRTTYTGPMKSTIHDQHVSAKRVVDTGKIAVVEFSPENERFYDKIQALRGNDDDEDGNKVFLAINSRNLVTVLSSYESGVYSVSSFIMIGFYVGEIACSGMLMYKMNKVFPNSYITNQSIYFFNFFLLA